MKFSHLHCHTQYSLLDGASSIDIMVQKAVADGMPGVAITDHGNMFGVFQFVNSCQKHNIKPIVGCEFYLVNDRHKKSFSKEAHDVRYHQLMLAKNQAGYHNISKLCSLGYLEGLYSKYPRIDKKLIEQYHEGLIATTCCLGAEVPQMILHKGEEEAEKAFKWWLDLFGDDYYIELQRHSLPEQEQVNAVLLKFAAKYNVKIIASNDSHYVNKEDADAQDTLLCINTGEKKATPIGEGMGKRFGFANKEFYFKSTEEMTRLFADIPQAIDNTNHIFDKIEPPKIKRDVLVPNYPLPEGFATAYDYLEHLTWQGARRRYKEIDDEIEERVNFELQVINKMGFAGYFLIVWDFIEAAKNMGVWVGPGRGSVAGSVIAYCLGISNIDPIKYNLLFERFLNPERVSMPDIDTDFDDIGRARVLDYVVKKYGQRCVAQIITYGTMAAKSSIKDVARVLDLPLDQANAITKLIPSKGVKSIAEAYSQVPELKAIRKGTDLRAKVLEIAEKLEGNVRNTGVHAAGVIIAPADITDFVPVSTAKDTDLMVTQYEGNVIESAGLLKMDFLGLSTLNIQMECVRLIEKRSGIKIDLDNIPLDDVQTFEMYQKGLTVGTFQFESEGMRKYLRDLKPTNIEDLIAMNALYRPGPISSIPQYIARKNGKEAPYYWDDRLKPLLENTYGIIVYQEQVMQIVQALAGFTKGEADNLRKAMSKKNMPDIEKYRNKFVEGAVALGCDAKKMDDLYNTMARFGEYGFNRSHSAAYSVLSYQTGYLKANYSAEYMAAVLTVNKNSTDDLTTFLDECRQLKINVLPPDINESDVNFTVNSRGEIRFGLSAIKGFGEVAAEAIVNERTLNGPYKSVFDLTRRNSAKSVNKKYLEALVYSGAFDTWGYHRAMYFTNLPGRSINALEEALKWGNMISSMQASSANTLFGDMPDVHIPDDPQLPDAEPMRDIEKLIKERETIGLFISGHPLDRYKRDLTFFCNATLDRIDDFKERAVTLAGLVSSVAIKTTKKDNAQFAIVKLEDYFGNIEFTLFNESYLKYKHLLVEGEMLYLKGKYALQRPRFQDRNANANNNANDELLPTYRLQVDDLMLLSSAREKLVKGIKIDFSTTDITETLLTELKTLFKNHPGKYPVKMVIQHEPEVPEQPLIKVDMASSRLTVDLLDFEFTDTLNSIPGLKYALTV